MSKLQKTKIDRNFSTVFFTTYEYNNYLDKNIYSQICIRSFILRAGCQLIYENTPAGRYRPYISLSQVVPIW